MPQQSTMLRIISKICREGQAARQHPGAHTGPRRRPPSGPLTMITATTMAAMPMRYSFPEKRSSIFWWQSSCRARPGGGQGCWSSGHPSSARAQGGGGPSPGRSQKRGVRGPVSAGFHLTPMLKHAQERGACSVLRDHKVRVPAMPTGGQTQRAALAATRPTLGKTRSWAEHPNSGHGTTQYACWSRPEPPRERAGHHPGPGEGGGLGPPTLGSPTHHHAP